MTCWCGHGPWHHSGYAYPLPYYYPQPPPPAYRPGPREPDARTRLEELETTLRDLHDELARLREEMSAGREGGRSE
jgi:hypothetical protein